MRVKDINIKNRTYYFFNDIINSKDFDSDNIKIDGKSYKNIIIYYIEKKRPKHLQSKSFIPHFE